MPISAPAGYVLPAPKTTEATRRQGWEALALAHAEEEHLLGSAHYLGASAERETIELFSVRNAAAGSIYYGRHMVAHDLVSGTLTCDCLAGDAEGEPCGHAGAVVAWLQSRAEALLRATATDADSQAYWDYANLGGRYLDINRGW